MEGLAAAGLGRVGWAAVQTLRDSLIAKFGIAIQCGA
jgi:hypothetical protein